MKQTPFDIIIIHRNTLRVTSECIDSILASSSRDVVRIIVVDNASSDGSAEELRRAYPQVILIEAEENLGYGKACNLGARSATNDFMIFSNSDVRYTSHCMDYLVRCLVDNDDVALCGPQQYFPDGSWQRSHDLFPGPALAMRNLFGITAIQRVANAGRTIECPTTSRIRDVEYVDGAVLAVRASAFAAVGGFDERYFFFCEDVELCHALRAAGHRVCHVSEAKAFHERGFTRRRNVDDEIRYLGANERARAMFLRTHETKLRVRFTLIVTTAYYAANVVASFVMSLVVSSGRRERLRDKIRILQHLVNVCADELESSYETK